MVGTYYCERCQCPHPKIMPCPSVASDCSGADDRQSDVERSGNPKRSGDSRFDSAISAMLRAASEMLRLSGHDEMDCERDLAVELMKMGNRLKWYTIELRRVKANQNQRAQVTDGQ